MPLKVAVTGSSDRRPPHIDTEPQASKPKDGKTPSGDLGTHRPTGLGGARPFIGRASEFGELRTLVERMAEGRGGVILIRGEPGIGKSRTIEETVRYASERGIPWIGTVCQESELAVPYAPWVHLLRELVRTLPRAAVRRAVLPGRGAVLRLAPEVADLIWLATGEPSAPVDRERPEFLEAVARVFVELAHERALLVTIDDFGWVDVASLELVKRLALKSTSSGLGVLLAARDVQIEENPRLQHLDQALHLAGRGRTISLPPFTLEEVGQLIGGLLGETVISEEFRALVHEKSGGNPLYVEEILRSLADDGALFLSEGRWERKPISDLRLPETIRTMIQERLGRLDPKGREVLRVASVLGMASTLSIIKSVSGFSENRILSGLEQALRFHLLVERVDDSNDSKYVFVHPLMREVLSSEVSRDRGMRYHLRAAVAMEKQLGDRAAQSAGEIAYHYLRGNNTERALSRSVQAAERAAAVFAHEDAIRFDKIALGLLKSQPNPSLRCQILRRLARSSFNAGRVKESLEFAMPAAEEYAALGRLEDAGFMYRGIGFAYAWALPEPEKAEAAWERAREMLDRGPPNEALGRLLEMQARWYCRRGDTSKARQLTDRLESVSKRLESPSLAAATEIALTRIARVVERSTARAHMDRALEIATQHSIDPDLVASAMFRMQVDGDVDAAINMTRRAIETANASGEPRMAADLRGQNLAMALLYAGDLVEAEREALAGYEYAVSHYPQPDAPNLTVLGEVLVRRGELAKGESLLVRARELGRATPFSLANLVNEYFLARLYLDQSRTLEGESALVSAWSRLEEQEDLVMFALAKAQLGSALVEAKLALERPRESRPVLDRLQLLERSFAGDVVTGLVRRAEGKFAAARGQRVQASSLIGESCRVFARLGWKYELGRSFLEKGRLEFAGGARVEAAQSLDAAADIFATIGAKEDSDRTLAIRQLILA
ncbi:MAG TPA: AAA family ATPase [Thermoplasmata archaeon]|nr:AAA family ATPase [Thermoplasmata archaeon]